MATMKIAIFAKKRNVEEIDAKTGATVLRPFYTYLTTLVNKSTGEVLPVQVKFRQACGAPDPATCPCFINIDKQDANLSWEDYMNDEGETLKAAKMWVTKWTPAGAYVDHSLDEFDAFGA